MATISCPGQENFSDKIAKYAYGIRAEATKKAAVSRVNAAIAEAFLNLEQTTKCSKGCYGPYWKIIEKEAYVYSVTRYWFTLWILVCCEAHGKYHVKASCTTSILSDALESPIIE